MLKGAEDSERITEFYEYIQSEEVRKAFALLLGTFVCLKQVTCRVSRQKKIRSIAVDLAGRWCLSIMPSQESLLFQWRPPVIEMKRYQKHALMAQFPGSFTDDSHTSQEHWAVRIESREDAVKLIEALDLR